MRAAPALLAVAALALAGCGAGGPDTITDLKDMVVEAGVECPEFGQVEPSGFSAAHGSCQDSSFPDQGFGLDLYADAEDRDKALAGWEDLPLSYCIVYGETWSVNFIGDSEDSDCEVVADRLDGEIVRG